jgi:hypothetical protein
VPALQNQSPESNPNPTKKKKKSENVREPYVSLIGVIAVLAVLFSINVITQCGGLWIFYVELTEVVEVRYGLE